ncbi:hypothetical protein MicloDRAFT_00030920 [Microvirga lotononidis]|uniref:DUF1254 domain-containing protein n=2 Tax=Microvirga lotononidis TaxID=864069 RepID=I4YRF1_9HYPH|nr:hypothetical protein MicloDRAFT_00030920 [Microvirga lotononidis]
MTMKLTRRQAAIGALSLLAGTTMSTVSEAHLGELLGLDEGLEDFWLATDAYIYGYPLVTMEMTRRVITNVAAPEGTRAPMGQVIKLRHYPDATFRDVTAPNADTLYTTAFFDVGKEPWVLSLPDMKDRYFLMPMLDGWTTVFQVPGKRTTGTGAQTYAITGPGWSGTLPAGVKEYKSPTNIVWLLGRIYCTGTPEDYAEVHALQDQVKLVPLSAYGKPYTPPAGKVDPSIDMKTAVRDQVNRMDAVAYFTLLAELMKTNPPSAADAPALAKFAKIGLLPGQDFDASKLRADFARRIPEIANDRIMIQFKINKDVHDIDGWGFTTKTGIYGTDYLMRALVTAIGLGANRPQDAVYPTSQKDGEGQTYDGANKYVMRFAKGQLPPVEGFWSLTMYDGAYFFVPNPINRYSISARQDLKANPDGSVDLYIQKDSPGADKESNWLPAPAGKFILMLRMYWPNESNPSIIDGTWTIPPVRQVSDRA